MYFQQFPGICLKTPAAKKPHLLNSCKVLKREKIIIWFLLREKIFLNIQYRENRCM
ncbi:hypothetical protein KSU1_B0607 [Candidatus Jettenia caeni]|uniref:Uncharacterized protein n=1 Tax=Candidatus Jettenia caeni TaxID=247490 RepID=I3IIB9_9BACT|nr:hypothetical protein KSU1_B0607 [Candidatus Jettenia caeni]